MNAAIDLALRAPSAQHLAELAAQWPSPRRPGPLVERIRRRATRLARAEPEMARSILAARDWLVLAAYGQVVPDGWHLGWCDGSLDRSARTRAGLGVLLCERDGRVLLRQSISDQATTAFAAEAAALALLLEAASGLGLERLRVHTDCTALVGLWLKHCNDPRLSAVREARERVSGFQLRAVPASQNRIDHQLAYGPWLGRALAVLHPDPMPIDQFAAHPTGNPQQPDHHQR